MLGFPAEPVCALLGDGSLETLWVNAGKALHRASGKQGKGASLSCVLLSRE